MKKQDKVATAESVVKVFAEALLDTVKKTAIERRREPVLCWSSRDVRKCERQSAMSYAHEYYRYSHSMD